MSASHVWHPFTQHGLQEPVLDVARAEGANLWTTDGRRIFDAISSWWVTTHGHCHPKIGAAIARQASTLDQLIFAGCTHEPAEQVARELAGLLPGLPWAFYSDSGSTSVEVALKMALGFWGNRGEPRHRIVVMQHSYHGDTIGAMSVGERGVFNAAYKDLLFEVSTVPFPHEGQHQQTLDALEQTCRRDKPAAFLVEPLVLGAGGMLMYPPAVLRQMREICAEANVLFIADEVMTGWGRTGTMFACEQAGIVPDLMCLAKGLTGGALPLAVTMASEAVFQAHWSQDRTKTFYHSSSYTANPIACAAALANLDIWREEPVIARVEELARVQAEGLAQVADLPIVSHPRQCGTIAAFDVRSADASGYLAPVGRRIAELCLDAGFLLRPLGSSIYVMPPYCSDRHQLLGLYSTLCAVLNSLIAEKRATP